MRTLRSGKLPILKLLSILVPLCLAGAVAATAQTFTSLQSFDSTEGRNPSSGALVQGINGNFFGTAGNGGANAGADGAGAGTVFEITSSGKMAPLYSFCSLANCADGEYPYPGLMLATNGNFYGTTPYGGTGNTDRCTNPNDGCGTLFEITPGGKLTTLYNFCSQASCVDGQNPLAALVQGANGNLYGTTNIGGTSNSQLCSFLGCGTIFEITLSGELTTLYSFCAQNLDCPDGISPNGLTLGPDGNFYGTSGSAGNTVSGGTFFKITPTGAFTTLHSFVPGTQGATPSSLILAPDGNFYGTTAFGGANAGVNGDGAGTVFKITPAGVVTNLYNFCSQADCADGSDPNAALVLGTDGNFYSTTIRGGANNDTADCIGGCGTVFSITPSGAITTLYNFCAQANCTDGAGPYAGLAQGTDGSFYGTTNGGGVAGCFGIGCGTVFSVSVGLGPFVEANPIFGKAGRIITILGNNLTGTTSVTFNGTPATFEVASSTHIEAEVPTGATTGTIEVTTPSGTLSSNVAFHVGP